ncbi:unnamed protein product [Peniophora sp. CBMAI 1063]|nr:unnamed protein product [Peniophora sp. CBMAI 1063]
MVNISYFPSFLPMENRPPPSHVEINAAQLELVLQAATASEATLKAGSSTSIVTTTALVSSTVEWLENAAEKLRLRLQYMVALQNEQANFMAPVARLPEEILRIIFRYNVDCRCTYIGDYPTISTVTNWMRLGQICRLWRRITFDMSAVWAEIIYGAGGRKATHTLLPLARSALLNLRTTECLLHSDLASTIPGLFHRARRISHSSRTPGDANRFIDLITSQPLPHLRVLVFTPRTGFYMANLGLHINLRFLTLSHVVIQPSFPCGLTRLDLSYSDEEWVDGESMGDYLETITGILSHNPALQYISITWSTEDSDWPLESDHGDHARIFLPALREIYFDQWPPTHTLSALNHIRAPMLEVVTIRESNSYRGAVPILQAFASAIRAWCAHDTQAGSKLETAIIPSDQLTVSLDSALLIMGWCGDDLYDNLDKLCKEYKVYCSASGHDSRTGFDSSFRRGDRQADVQD